MIMGQDCPEKDEALYLYMHSSRDVRALWETYACLQSLSPLEFPLLDAPVRPAPIRGPPSHRPPSNPLSPPLASRDGYLQAPSGTQEALDASWLVWEMPEIGDCESEYHRPFACVGKGSFMVKGFSPEETEMMAKVKGIVFYLPGSPMVEDLNNPGTWYPTWKGPFGTGLEVIHKRVGVLPTTSYAYVQFVVAIPLPDKDKWVFGNDWVLTDVTFGVRYTYLVPTPGKLTPGPAIIATAGLQMSKTTITVGIQLGCCRSDRILLDSGMYFEIKQISLFDIINGFASMFGWGEFGEDGLLHALFSEVKAKFEVCMAYSEITFVDLDVQCRTGFEFSGELGLWGSTFVLEAKAALEGKIVGAFEFVVSIRDPFLMIPSLIASVIETCTGGKPGLLGTIITTFLQVLFRAIQITRVEFKLDSGAADSLISFELEVMFLGIRTSIKWPSQDTGSVDHAAVGGGGFIGMLSKFSPVALMSIFNFELPDSLSDVLGEEMDNVITSNPSMECSDSYPISMLRNGTEVRDPRRLRKKCLFKMAAGSVQLGLTTEITTTFCHEDAPGAYFDVQVRAQRVQVDDGKELKLCTQVDPCEEDEDEEKERDAEEAETEDGGVGMMSSYDQKTWDPQASDAKTDRREQSATLEITDLVKVAVYDYMGWEDEPLDDTQEQGFWVRKRIFKLGNYYHSMRLKGFAYFTTGLERHRHDLRDSPWNAHRYASWDRDLSAYLQMNLKMEIQFAEIRLGSVDIEQEAIRLVNEEGLNHETAIERAVSMPPKYTDVWKCPLTIDLSELLRHYKEGEASENTQETAYTAGGDILNGGDASVARYLDSKLVPFNECLDGKVIGIMRRRVTDEIQEAFQENGNLAVKMVKWLTNEFPGFYESREMWQSPKLSLKDLCTEDPHAAYMPPSVPPNPPPIPPQPIMPPIAPPPPANPPPPTASARWKVEGDLVIGKYSCCLALGLDLCNCTGGLEMRIEGHGDIKQDWRDTATNRDVLNSPIYGYVSATVEHAGEPRAQRTPPADRGAPLSGAPPLSSCGRERSCTTLSCD